MVLYPEYRNTSFYKPWFSQHAAFEDIYFPISQENGHWTNTSVLTEIRFSSDKGVDFLPGSRVGAYKTNTSSGLRHVVGAGGESSVTLQVPAGNIGLRVIVVARSDANEVDDRVMIELNGDTTTSNYVNRRASASSGTHETAQNSDNEFGVIPASTAGSNILGCGVLAIPQHEATDRHKHILSTIGAAGGRIGLYGGRWKSTSAVTSITFKPRTGNNFVENSVFEIVFAAE